jgi:hypothetical protein
MRTDTRIQFAPSSPINGTPDYTSNNVTGNSMGSLPPTDNRNISNIYAPIPRTGRRGGKSRRNKSRRNKSRRNKSRRNNRK